MLTFFLRGFSQLINQQFLFKVFFKVKTVLFNVLSGRSLSYLKKSSQSNHQLSLFPIRCHSLSLVVPLPIPLVVFRWYSFSFAGTCNTCCNSLSLVVPLVCLFINGRFLVTKGARKCKRHKQVLPERCFQKEIQTLILKRTQYRVVLIAEPALSLAVLAQLDCSLVVLA